MNPPAAKGPNLLVQVQQAVQRFPALFSSFSVSTRVVIPVGRSSRGLARPRRGRRKAYKKQKFFPSRLDRILRRASEFAVTFPATLTTYIIEEMNGDRSTLTDAELVFEARQGSLQAFETLVDRYQALALRIARRLIPNDEEAQDLVQETLLEAYLSLYRLREPERFKSWLLGILLNLGRNRLRRSLRQTEHYPVPLDWDLASELADQKPQPQQVAEERELHRQVLAAVDELPLTLRDALWLFYFEAMSLQEIGVLLGISVNAVKVRLHRARHSLRKKLEVRYPEVQFIERKVDRRKQMIKVSIADVIKHQEKTIVLLLSEAQDRVLPMWIGEFEGASIAMGMTGFQTPRPLTYEFISHLLTASNVTLEEVHIESIKSDTFYGVARLRIGEVMKEVDARPSDVLALAIRTGSPIYVADEIMAQAGKAVRPGIAMPDNFQDTTELPIPGGEGMQAILEEMKAVLSRGSSKK
jgi:RNA polymerase sigma factor (sigma-70 family)